jgi:hypothetical protein
MTQKKSSNSKSTAAIALGAIAFLFFPVIFGPISIILAALAKGENEPNANLSLGIGITGTVVGMLLGAAVAGA